MAAVKWLFPWIAFVALGVGGFWVGMRASRSAALEVNVLAVVALVMGCNVVLCGWLWYRAPAGSGDAMVLPTITLVSAAMLANVLPRLFWPGAWRLQIAGTIVSVAVPAILLIRQIRQRRSARRAASS